ncbi:alpha/beta-hydrolase [Marasmius fiardii PR-910]|nr:alpha/beta-hydrolase [Marasmius fiardii PR-910]
MGTWSAYWTAIVLRLAVVLTWSSTIYAQRPISLPSTFPHNYTGIPKGGFSPEWQGYFQVKDTLPNVTEPISRSFAGNIAVDRAGHPNDTLWFWAFEREEGSLTAQAGERENEPWLVWLNGGPGSSSQLGLMTENGPLRVQGDFSITQNNFSWHKLADAFWVDQPVGTGYSTSDANGYVFDEDQLGQDFVGFLSNVVKVFPSLATRPFFLTGESYAGVYIPYIAKAILSTPNPPVKLRKIAIGDGAMGSFPGYEEISTVSTLETYPQIINFDQEVFQYFREQTHLCGYDLNLTYPQTGGHFKSLLSPFNVTHDARIVFGGARANGLGRFDLNYLSRADFVSEFVKRSDREDPHLKVKRQRQQQLTLDQWKRSHLHKGTLDLEYGCFLWEEMTDFAMNFTFPWSQGEFDPYDTPDALSPEVPADPSVFLNDPRTRAALHAPDKTWVSSFRFPFGNSTGITPAGSPWGDRSVEPAAFMSELWTNASQQNVGIVIYEGNSDSLVAHYGAEVVIQNTTFGGIQGFTRRPSTPFPGGSGIIHQERNITYALFADAGHFVPRSLPEPSFIFLREFILGDNSTGLVEDNGNGGITVVGGEDPSLTGAILSADTAAIFYGKGRTASSSFAPTATIAGWRSFIQTATATARLSETRQQNGAEGEWMIGSGVRLLVGVGFTIVTSFLLL